MRAEEGAWLCDGYFKNTEKRLNAKKVASGKCQNLLHFISEFYTFILCRVYIMPENIDKLNQPSHTRRRNQASGPDRLNLLSDI